MGTSSHPRSSGSRGSGSPPGHLSAGGAGSGGLSLGTRVKRILPGVGIWIEPMVSAAISALCNLVVFCNVHKTAEEVAGEYGLGDLPERPSIMLMNAVAAPLKEVPRRTILADLAEGSFRQTLMGLLVEKPRLLTKATAPEIHQHVRGFSPADAMYRFCSNYLFQVLECARDSEDLPFLGLADQLKSFEQNSEHEAEMRRYAERMSRSIVGLLIEQSRERGTPFGEVRRMLVSELEEIVAETKPEIARLMAVGPDQIQELAPAKMAA